jgi:hypothetical protein
MQLEGFADEWCRKRVRLDVDAVALLSVVDVADRRGPLPGFSGSMGQPVPACSHSSGNASKIEAKISANWYIGS